MLSIFFPVTNPFRVDISSIIKPLIVDISHHPTFQFVKAASKSFKVFDVECGDGVAIDFDILGKVLGAHKEFRIINRHGDLTIEREVPVEEENIRREINQRQDQENQPGLLYSMFAPCFGVSLSEENF